MKLKDILKEGIGGIVTPSVIGNVTNEGSADLLKIAQQLTGKKEQKQIMTKEEYKPHFDGFLNPSENNQRIYTAILYLSECSGGETFFDKLSIKIKAVKGSICLFENCINNTDHINPGSLHSGLKVKNGEKIIMTFWFRRHNF